MVNGNQSAFKKSLKPRKRQRTRETVDGTLVANIEDMESWQDFYNKQVKLEKLRMYFCVVGWQILSKVFPKHKVFGLFEDIVNSPEYLRQKLGSDDIDILSLSMSSLGKIPGYNVLGLNKGEILSVKSEPLDE